MLHLQPHLTCKTFPSLHHKTRAESLVKSHGAAVRVDSTEFSNSRERTGRAPFAQTVKGYFQILTMAAEITIALPITVITKTSKLFPANQIPL